LILMKRSTFSHTQWLAFASCISRYFMGRLLQSEQFATLLLRYMEQRLATWSNTWRVVTLVTRIHLGPSQCWNFITCTIKQGSAASVKSERNSQRTLLPTVSWR